MIRCLSLNPCLDKMAACPAFSPEQTNRIRPLRSDIGGKGVNVARVLTALGAESRLYSFDFSGAPMEKALKKEKIDRLLIPVERELRVNLKIRAEDRASLIEISEAGEAPGEEALNALLSAFLEDCRPGDWGVLSGSVANGVSPAVYRDMTLRLHEKGCQAAVDCDGEALSLALEAAPDLIKPNDQEFARLTGARDEKEIREALQRLHREGKAGRVCLSLGPRGALLSLPDALWRCEAADVPVLSTTGAGDSMLAGLLAALTRGLPEGEALCFASAAAGASVMRPGTLLCQREDQERLLPQLTAESIPLTEGE